MTETGSAYRASKRDAKRAFLSGATVLVTDRDRGPLFDVGPLTTTHQGGTAEWDALMASVDRWRRRYPAQTFYVVTEATEATMEATEAQLAQARYLGADAALAAASWLTMNEADAQSILDDVDPEVMDRYREPTLTGEWDDVATPEALGNEILGPRPIGDNAVTRDEIAANVREILGADGVEALSAAWHEGRDEVWSDALQAHALRVLGDVIRALDVEQRNERTVNALRTAAG